MFDTHLYLNTSSTLCSIAILKPLKIYTDLSRFKSGKNNTNAHIIKHAPPRWSVTSAKKELYKKGGVYSFIYNGIDGKTMQYIGSSKNLYERMQDHLTGRDSNSRLQRSITKHGLDKFTFVIYYWHQDPLVILTDMETEIIKSFLRLGGLNPCTISKERLKAF